MSEPVPCRVPDALIQAVVRMIFSQDVFALLNQVQETIVVWLHCQFSGKNVYKYSTSNMKEMIP